jgi:hypothetical protein
MIIRHCISHFTSLFNPSFQEKFIIALDALQLNENEKNIIKFRYVDMVYEAEKDYRRICILYIILTNIITISGVLITALLSLNKMQFISTHATTIFWVVWSLSIIVTLANKWVHSYNIDKKYILNTSFLEKLYSEGWSFVSGIDTYDMVIHERYSLFCTRIEQLKMKSLENITDLQTSKYNDILGQSSNVIVTEDPQADNHSTSMSHIIDIHDAYNPRP